MFCNFAVSYSQRERPLLTEKAPAHSRNLTEVSYTYEDWLTVDVCL